MMLLARPSRSPRPPKHVLLLAVLARIPSLPRLLTGPHSCPHYHSPSHAHSHAHAHALAFPVPRRSGSHLGRENCVLVLPLLLLPL